MFAEIMRTLPLAAAMFDREMRYISHNVAWAKVHGAGEDADFVGKRHQDLFEVTDQWREANARGLAGATEKRDLEPVAAREGSALYIRSFSAPWRDEDGEIGGLVFYSEDITEPVLTRQRLAERESLIKDLFELSPVGLNLCRMDGLWLESNKAFCEIIGYTQAEADGGLTYWQLTPRKYDAQEQVQLETLRTTRRYGPYEKEFIRKDGRLVPVRLNGFLVEREGQTYIWSLIEDLTSQRALEADLEQERLKAIQASKLATIGEMAAGIAHDLNNPLGIIDAFGFVIEDALARGDLAKAKEAARGVRDAATRAGKIVQGLRKFTRQSTNDPPEEVTVRELVEEAVALCTLRLRNHDVDLAVDVDTTARVRGRAIELVQLLVNLVNNAIDAVRGAATRWVRISAEDLDGVVSVAVEDAGAGVPPDIATDVFKAFFTTKKVGEGTGLGLSISRSIADRHGGTLTLDGSAPHTRFVLRLPRVDP